MPVSVPYCQSRKRNDEVFLSSIELQSIVFIFEGGAMFITHKNAEISLGAYLGDESTQYWQCVEHTTQA
ncbi:hypothetical protein Pfra02_33930 [Pseudomonas fragi]|nr:hypothetical protein Pfra02_33930 [Pseudomonas fragi]